MAQNGLWAPALRLAQCIQIIGHGIQPQPLRSARARQPLARQVGHDQPVAGQMRNQRVKTVRRGPRPMQSQYIRARAENLNMPFMR